MHNATAKGLDLNHSREQNIFTQTNSQYISTILKRCCNTKLKCPICHMQIEVICSEQFVHRIEVMVSCLKICLQLAPVIYRKNYNSFRIKKCERKAQ